MIILSISQTSAEKFRFENLENISRILARLGVQITATLPDFFFIFPLLLPNISTTAGNWRNLFYTLSPLSIRS